MSSIDGNIEFNMSNRTGESVTDIVDWDNEVIEWDSSTGVYYVAGKPVTVCHGVSMFKEKSSNDQV